MNAPEHFDTLVLGGGTAGKLAAWTMAKEGRRTAVVDRKYIGGSCPNIACLPSKNVIYSAKVASLVGRQREFGIETAQAHAAIKARNSSAATRSCSSGAPDSRTSDQNSVTAVVSCPARIIVAA